MPIIIGPTDHDDGPQTTPAIDDPCKVTNWTVHGCWASSDGGSPLHDANTRVGALLRAAEVSSRFGLPLHNLFVANGVARTMEPTPSQRGMATIERATHFASGQIHVIAMQQEVAASAVTTNVLRTIAGEETNLTTRMLRDIGLEGDHLQELQDLIENNVIKVDDGKGV